MAERTTPYGAFNFLVDLQGRDETTVLGGFSDVSGLGTEITVSDYRNGNSRENHPMKVPALSKQNDITLKRGIVNSEDLWSWIAETRRSGVAARRQVVIKLCDETGEPVQQWTLGNVVPIKYTGPTLAAKGGGDVALEELVLASESMEWSKPVM